MPATANHKKAQAALTPPRPDDPVDHCSEEIRQRAVDFLIALDDCDYERLQHPEGVSLRTYERLRRAHTAIGTTLDLIRLEA